MKGVYLSIGSNTGDRFRSLQRAIEELVANGVTIERVSRIYETEPQGNREQGWFLNIAVEASTFLFPAQLLARIHKIEQKLKRRRTILNGPRTIDIDIIFYGETAMKTAELQIPHPRYASRRFVLAPLAEIAPELRDPVTRQTMQAMLSSLEGQPVKLSPLDFALKAAAR